MCWLLLLVVDTAIQHWLLSKHTSLFTLQRQRLRERVSEASSNFEENTSHKSTHIMVMPAQNIQKYNKIDNIEGEKIYPTI